MINLEEEEDSNGGVGPKKENVMLRNEIASLNQEMSQVLARAKTAEKGEDGREM